jgi:hypothetical protein
MSLDRQAELERIGRERAESERLADRAKLFRWLRAAAEVALACGIGLVIMFFAFWVNDRELGMIFLWSGMIVGYAGMAYALLSAYLRAEEAGDL